MTVTDILIVATTIWGFYLILRQCYRAVRSALVWFAAGFLKHWGDQVPQGVRLWLLRSQTPEQTRELIRIWNLS